MVLALSSLASSADAGTPRFDRSKFHIGVWRYREYLHDEAHVKELAECGIDYAVIDKGWDDKVLWDLFAKHGIGIMASGPVPRWSAKPCGQWAKTHPPEEYAKCLDRFVDHPAIWGINILDEISALDMPYAAKVVDMVRSRCTNQIVHFDMLPNYGREATNSTAEALAKSQLGTRSYREYIEAYCRELPVDFFSYDFFLYARPKTRGIQEYYENQRIVADACRATGRSFWFAPQVNSKDAGTWTSENCLRFQAYSAMAFGVESLAWCCWSAGWWTNQVIDATGARTRQYDRLKRVNAELLALAPTYMRYRSTATHFVGFEGTKWLEHTECRSQSSLNTGYFRDVRADDASPMLVAEMVDRTRLDGDRALFVFSADDPYDEAPGVRKLLFRTTGRVVARTPDGIVEPERNLDGLFAVPLKSNSFAMIERKER